MSLLVFFIVLSIGVSFLCSMLEAVILSVTPSYLASLRENKPKLYARVQNLKKDIEKPLASILTFNTVAHTIGAAGAGAEVQRIFGSEVFAIFSAILTFAILFLSEIIPKSIGASSWKTLLPISATILAPMIFISYPLVWLSERVSSLFKTGREGVSRDEIAAMADIGLHDGVIADVEHRALKGLIKFEEVEVADVLTPAHRVQGVFESDSVEEAYRKIQTHPYSRIIVFGTDRNDIKGYLLRTKLQDAYIKRSTDMVKDLTFPLLRLSGTIELPSLFRQLLKRREHICSITDDAGKFVGVLSLEDLIEHMLNLEIYDEQDHLVPE